MGRQWIYLRPGTAITQTVNLTAGTYNLSLSAMQWLGSGQQLPLKVTVGNGVSGQIPPDLFGATPPLTLPKMTWSGFSVPADAEVVIRIVVALPNPPLANNISTTMVGVWLDDVVLQKTGSNAHHRSR